MDSAPAPTHWVHDLSPFLIQFNENFGIRYYGLGYLLGFLLGGLILHRAAVRGRLPLPPPAVWDLLTALIVGVMVGGRLGYFVLYEPAVLFQSPLEVFKVWQGGMASHGGFAGVAVAMIWFARRHQLSFWQLSDAVVTAAPPGLFLVRVANFIKGELPGKISEVPWAVIFPDTAPPGTPVHLIAPRHPSQLYEAALEGLLLLGFTLWRYWRTLAPVATPGRLTGEFLIGYAFARSISELFREPDADLILGLSRGTFYSLFFVVAGIVLIVRSRPAKRA
ncbi:prolipoprotein diacylglyceryl transferase [Actomonas aquatica]|uniref:Phosphatidylglycerol--prolipoprotein diacylglyceryl transferase n=1 Tax=Actomonas aquatica TaxID=2866162 RepID=A0ABZ1CEP4_9BACT|nr:prolipoprotein diacylglyceryl transferase [Opitutus sp. WL0086]WRQ89079.1 prolipoprotein diacylglyceryl transferase [Opitutus sp. WL0086]